MPGFPEAKEQNQTLMEYFQPLKTNNLRYLEVSKLEKRCAWFFQSQRTKANVNGTFSAVENKQ